MIRDSNRILVVDDNESIHEDFRKILNTHRINGSKDLTKIEKELFDEEDHPGSITEGLSYRIDSAFQGQDAIDLIDRAAQDSDPFALVLMDVRMPPGINGIETIERIWTRHPYVEMVIVTAFSDYTWENILQTVGRTDRLMFLRKPFDPITVKQMALALTKKYNLTRKVRVYLEHMEKEVRSRNNQLESMVRELRGFS